MKRPKLLVCIAFHLVPARLPILKQVIGAYLSYEGHDVDIRIDTNTEETRALLADIAIPAGKSLSVKSWTLAEMDGNLLKLTWMHRPFMRSKQGAYDYYLYTEDDVLITRESFEFWESRQPELSRLGLVHGFVRVELSKSGTWVATDHKLPEFDPVIRRIGEWTYAMGLSPYQAFWLHDAATFELFLRDRQYETGYPPWKTRPKMAVGFAWREGADGSFENRCAIALDERGQVDPRARVRHLPDNYAARTSLYTRAWASVPIDELVKPPGLKALRARALLFANRIKRGIDRRLGKQPAR